MTNLTNIFGSRKISGGFLLISALVFALVITSGAEGQQRTSALDIPEDAYAAYSSAVSMLSEDKVLHVRSEITARSGSEVLGGKIPLTTTVHDLWASRSSDGTVLIDAQSSSLDGTFLTKVERIDGTNQQVDQWLSGIFSYTNGLVESGYKLVGSGTISGRNTLINELVVTSDPQAILESPPPDLLIDPRFEEIVRAAEPVTFKRELEYDPSNPLISRESTWRMNDQSEWTLDRETKTLIVEYVDAHPS